MVLSNPLYRIKQEKNIFQIADEKLESVEDLISMAVGDAAGPLFKEAIDAIQEELHGLSDQETFLGYPPETGLPSLKEKINKTFYQGRFSLEEIFISDGIKSDLFRLQTLLGPRLYAWHNDLSYPVYREGTSLVGSFPLSLATNKKNHFIPDFDTIDRADIIYICSPNNPTGVALPRTNLQNLFLKATQLDAFVIHDACYAPYIQSSDCPSSIYEIEGMEQVGIELGSFSKWGALSPLRLSWIVIPKEVRFSDGSLLKDAYQTLIIKTFNGVSRLSQAAGGALLNHFDKVKIECKRCMDQALFLRDFFEKRGIYVSGGRDCPYLFVETDLDFLSQASILTIPGKAFAPSGEGFIRMSLFLAEKKFEEAFRRLKKCFDLKLKSFTPS